MAEVGDDAPEFTAPIVDDDGVSEARFPPPDADGPIVLAFFPGAFSSTCTAELNAFGDRLDGFAAVDATVLGISTDLPWSLSEFRADEELPFGLFSDADGSVASSYGVLTDFPAIGLDAVARRSVFVVDASGTVTHRWLADDPGQEPDYDAVGEAVRAADA